jgi:CheY-like chemotaxis protein
MGRDQRTTKKQHSVAQMIKPPIVVLVVEDEALLRMHARQVVEDAGYKVLEASNADEAILLLETRADIRIVFTDINMPGSMDGVALARAIRNRWPPVELILTSGLYKMKAGDLPDRGRYFDKPYDPVKLVQALHELAPN